MNSSCPKPFVLFLRIALGTAFLSAVADRFGMWGAAGEANVFWGNFDSFLKYTALLNPYCPASIIPALGWFVTTAEVVLGFALILGTRTRLAALLSGTMLILFSLGQIIGVGIKAPLDFSVFTASAASFVLAFQEHNYLSIDSFLELTFNKNHSEKDAV